jgi:hypothetical protein
MRRVYHDASSDSILYLNQDTEGVIHDTLILMLGSVRREAAWVFALIFLSCGFFHQMIGWNQYSRTDVLHSLYGYDTLSIDAYHRNTGDKALINGQYYSDKAPGIVFMALPAFTGGAMILELFGQEHDSHLGWTTLSWIATLGSVGLLAAAGGAAFFLTLQRRIGHEYAMLATLAVFLGSGLWSYATGMFSHAGTGGLIALALWAVLHPAHAEKSRMSFRLDVVCGVFCGLAIASEFGAGVAVIGIALYAASIRPSRIIPIALGGFGPCLLIPLNNFLISGNPFMFGYKAVQEFPEMRLGFFGINKIPSPSALWLLLFSQAKGLFFWSPFLLLSIPGYVRLWKTERRLFWLLFLVPVIHTIIISSYFLPGGGVAVGPRLLVLFIPMLGMVAAYGIEKRRALSLVLAIVSMLLTFITVAINITPPEHMKYPLTEYYLRNIADDRYSMVLGASSLEARLIMVLLFLVLFIYLAASLMVYARQREK